MQLEATCISTRRIRSGGFCQFGMGPGAVATVNCRCLQACPCDIRLCVSILMLLGTTRCSIDDALVSRVLRRTSSRVPPPLPQGSGLSGSRPAIDLICERAAAGFLWDDFFRQQVLSGCGESPDMTDSIVNMTDSIVNSTTRLREGDWVDNPFSNAVAKMESRDHSNN